MLNELMQEASMSQAKLAVESGVSQSTISDLITGKKRPGLAVARALCEALAFKLRRPVTVDDVFPPVAHEADATGEEFD